MALAVTTITVPFSPFEESIVGSVAANAATDTSLDEYEGHSFCIFNRG